MSRPFLAKGTSDLGDFPIRIYTASSILRPSYTLTAALAKSATYRAGVQDRKDYEKAISNYNKAIRLNPEDNSAYLRSSENYQAPKNYNKAISDYSQNRAQLRRIESLTL